MSDLFDTWSKALHHHGYVVVHQSNEDSIKSFFNQLGSVVNECEVQINPKSRTYLSGAAAIPPHTDHPYVKWIAWHCLDQDMDDGANLLFDSTEFIKILNPDELKLISELILPMPERLDSLELNGSFHMYSLETSQFYFAAWLFKDIDHWHLEPILNKLEKLIKSRTIKVKLSPGDVLIINNHRYLHYRNSITEKSQRKLRRYWLI